MRLHLVALTCLMAGTPLALRSDPSAGTPKLDIVGTWRLVSTQQKMADGTTRPDPQTGAHGVGYIMYDATGHMCVFIADPDRPKWRDPAAPTDAEVRAAFQGTVAYCGTYEVNEQERSVTHRVETDRDPGAVGTTRKRMVSITGNKLSLRPTPLPAGMQEWNSEWERVR